MSFFRSSLWRTSLLASLMLAPTLLLPNPLFGQDQTGGATTATTPDTTAAPDNAAKTAKPDNSAKNRRHKKTAEQQSGAPSDRELTRKIRRAVVSDSSISTYGHNVKIITENGMVTLKGPVHTEEEKQAIASKAAEAAGGADKVTNQLSVKQ